jgi:hypothetical protein
MVETEHSTQCWDRAASNLVPQIGEYALYSDHFTRTACGSLGTAHITPTLLSFPVAAWVRADNPVQIHTNGRESVTELDPTDPRNS